MGGWNYYFKLSLTDAMPLKYDGCYKRNKPAFNRMNMYVEIYVRYHWQG